MSLDFDLGEDLKKIKGIRFTSREIEVLSCLSYGRSAKTIADLLNISPKTVENHTHNIMSKIGCNSREKVLDFIESSGKSQNLRHYYSTLKVNHLFQLYLGRLQKLQIKEQVGSVEVKGFEKHLEKELLNHIKSLGICLKVQKKPQENGYVLVLKGPAPESNGSIDLSDEKNYHLAFFRILTVLINNAQIQEISDEFGKAYEKIFHEPVEGSHSILASPSIQMPKVKNVRVIASLFLILLICGVSYYIKRPFQSHPIARSDLIIPNEAALLERPELIKEIETKLSGQNGIQSVALIGPGGSGKTTLARQYAHKQNIHVVWELNAETMESLKNSMESLAIALAKKEEDIRKVSAIKNLKNQQEKDSKIIEFVKEHLRITEPWILVYDNVEKFEDVQKHFPLDVVTWGKGQAIITTRNDNIHNNKFVNATLHVGELSKAQKLALFSKIISNGDQTKKTSIKVEETEKFLESIPSLPLDVTLAAYYVKSANETYHKYLEQISLNKTEFENIQHDILTETGDYKKTRYHIISTSIQSLIKAHPEFEDLLFLISVIDSQNIPRQLLNIYKSDILAVNFIRNLKKYSLITNESRLPSVGLVFSLHRSTQENTLNYFKNNLNNEEYENKINKVFLALETFSAGITATDDLPKMKEISPHLRSFLNQSDFLSPTSKGVTSCNLGYIFGYLGNYAQAMKFLNEGLKDLKESKDNELPLARASNQIGIIQTELGNYKAAIEYLELSLSIYYRYPHDKRHSRWVAYFNLADAYREIGEYKKAEKFLKESLNDFKHVPEKNPAYISWILYDLGRLYEDSCILDKAKFYFEECLLLYRKDLPKNHASYPLVLCHLGNIYRKLGHIKKAKSYVEQGITVCKSIFPHNHCAYADCLVSHGLILKELGDIKKARCLYEESLTIYRNLYNPSHKKIALTIRLLAKLDWLEGKKTEAESLLKESLRLYEINQSPQIYKVLKDLSEIMASRYQEAITNGDIKGAEVFKRKGGEYLMKANEIKTLIFLKSD